MATENTLDNWLSSWPDAVAFAAGLGVAWWASWNTTDLVWSLWLSSLVVGYSTMVWMIGQPVVELMRASWRDRALVASQPRALVTFWTVLLAVALFALAFFTNRAPDGSASLAESREKLSYHETAAAELIAQGQFCLAVEHLGRP